MSVRKSDAMLYNLRQFLNFSCHIILYQMEACYLKCYFKCV